MAHAVSIVESLRSVDLFRDFDDATLSLVADRVHTRRHAAGHVLFRRGDAADAMFIVASGKVRLSVASAEGRDLILRYATEGAVFGEIALLDGGERTADAKVQQDSVLLVIARHRMLAALERNPEVAQALINGLCRRLRETTDQLESIALLPLEQRLARLLLHLARAGGCAAEKICLALDISQSEIAMLIGASRPKVNQIMVAWHGAGIAARTPQGLLVDTVRLGTIVDGDMS